MNDERERLQAMLADDGMTWDLSPNDKRAIKWALDEIDRLQAFVDKHLHQRKCRSCGNVAYHADSIVPYCLCTVCGSQDTRKVKAEDAKEEACGTCDGPDCEGCSKVAKAAK